MTYTVKYTQALYYYSVFLGFHSVSVLSLLCTVGFVMPPTVCLIKMHIKISSYFSLY